MRRVTDSAEIAKIAAGAEAARIGDVTPSRIASLASPENVILVDDATGACAVFEHEGGGIYDLHWVCTGRGAGKLLALKRMVRALFTDYGGCGIYGFISRDNRAARVVARWLGGTFGGAYTDAAGHQLAVYAQTKEQNART
jgi:hypothetical protein